MDEENLEPLLDADLVDNVLEDMETDEIKEASATELYAGNKAIVPQDKFLTKQNFVQTLVSPLDDYEGLTLSPKEMQRLQAFVSRLSTGTRAMVPLICASQQCPFAHVCPLVKMNKAPIGKQCPIEHELINIYTIQYMEEHGVEPTERSKMAIIGELSEIEIMERRAVNALSKEGQDGMTIDEVVSIGENGLPIKNKKAHPAFDILLKLKNRKTKLLDIMVATPEAKYKRDAALKRRDAGDYSNKLTQLRALLESAQKTIPTTVVNAEFSEASDEENEE